VWRSTTLEIVAEDVMQVILYRKEIYLKLNIWLKPETTPLDVT
jgi:hypothetical protein